MNKQTKVVNIKRDKYDVYIGRVGHGQNGYLGNPYHVNYDGNREEVLELYRKYFYDRICNDIEFKHRIHELKGKILGCFCKPKLCHGDIICEYLNDPKKDKMIKISNCKCQIEHGKFDINNIELTCIATWNLISSGLTTGIFQLESKLGKDWASKVKPENIKELAALISILRPAALESGQSDTYVDNKFGFAQHKTLHPIIDEILKDTYFSLVYQEQAMKIAVEIAGFSLIDSDTLRSAIGKKKADLMSKMKIKFLEGAKKKGIVSEEVSQEIFSWIEKGQRYGFNYSHALSYAMLAYQSAYIKCHFPKEFFVSYLNFSNYKQDPKEEIYNLVQDARLFGINISPPDVRYKNIDFKIINDNICFGLGHIRSVGPSAVNKILNKSDLKLDTWIQFIEAVPELHRNVGIALIKSGACDCYGLKRLEMIRELEILLGTITINDQGKKEDIRGLTDKEKKYFFSKMNSGMTIRNILLEMANQVDVKSLSTMNKNELIAVYEKLLNEQIPEKSKKSDLIEKLKTAGYNNNEERACANENRRKIMAEKAELLEESISETFRSRAEAEKHFLGISLSCSATDDVDCENTTHSCLEVATSSNEEKFTVCAIIDNVTHTVTKKGKKPGSPMCFLTISDATYSLERSVVFPNVYQEFKHLCQPDFICLISGVKKNGSYFLETMKKLI